MNFPFAILAGLTLAAAVAAMTLRNLVHCALALTGALAGLAALYLQLDAQFVGFAQILVYLGAVAILIVFAVLLTRGGEPPAQRVFSASWIWGAGVAVAVCGTLAWAIHHSVAVERVPAPQVRATVQHIGEELMSRYVLPLQVVGLLLTAALIGAVLIAMGNGTPETRNEQGEAQRDAEAGDAAGLQAPSAGRDA